MTTPRFIVEPVDNHWEVWDTQGPAGTRQLICVLHNEFGATETCRLLNDVYPRIEREPEVDPVFKANYTPKPRWDGCRHDWRPVKSNGDLVLYRCRNCRLEALE